MKVAITGIDGFIGTHLKNYLSTQQDIEVIGISKEDFQSSDKLEKAVSDCDAMVHLAAVNRSEEPEELFRTNVQLVESLVDACERANSKPHIIFSSSLQEIQDNPYGRSKSMGVEILARWSEKCRGSYTALVIPNVFGPFGKPHYNSVVATFCHQIAIGENPIIVEDREISLIYINDLVREMVETIRNPRFGKVNVNPKIRITVSALLELLKSFRQDYLGKNRLPALSSSFELALFNTFRCYLPHDTFPFKLKKNEDDRGAFVEIMRNNSGGQFSFSTTKPGITRGNHFHTRKFERFTVIEGQASIKLRRIDKSEIIEYTLVGDEPAFVDMPIWHTHNITNTGDKDLITLFWINEPYDQSDPDTFFVEV